MSLLHAAAHSRKEDTARAGLTFVVSVVRDRCGSWPHSRRMNPQVGERQVDLHTVLYAVLLTKAAQALSLLDLSLFLSLHFLPSYELF